jgi:hypothetical protein
VLDRARIGGRAHGVGDGRSHLIEHVGIGAGLDVGRDLDGNATCPVVSGRTEDLDRKRVLSDERAQV